MNFQEIAKSIKGIEDNSINIKKDYVFFALNGEKTHGAKFINDAIKNGAKFVITDKKYTKKLNNNDVKILQVDNPRKYLSKLLSIFYREKPEDIVAVTGTNGKTSVVNFYQQICDLLKFKSASIGTLGLINSNKEYKFKENLSLTSPMHIQLHKLLKELYNNNITYVAIEASSHGIIQHRLDNIAFKAVGFTNFSQDHLDYHFTLEAYFNAKLRIFNEILQEGKYAVLNADINEFDTIHKVCKQRNIKVIEYGKKARDLEILSSKDGRWEVKIFGERYFLETKIKGTFQLYNILCAVGLAIACNLPIDKIIHNISNIKPARGRLELVSNYSGSQIYVDYAHTPDSLKTVLQTLRSIFTGKLHVLFGCGGQRDTSKRFLMGSIAKKLADYVIITDDNPREEDPSLIRKQILKACPKAKEIDGREKAIKYAIGNLKKNDILLIAGKGHEDYQIIGKKKIHFSDFEQVKKCEKC